MEIGEVRMYKGRVPVLITGGQRYGSSGGISNFWYFRRVNKDGTLGRNGSDYDNGPFTGKMRHKKVTLVLEIEGERLTKTKGGI